MVVEVHPISNRQLTERIHHPRIKEIPMDVWKKYKLDKSYIVIGTKSKKEVYRMKKGKRENSYCAGDDSLKEIKVGQNTALGMQDHSKWLK